jgi:thiol-disulfide isomerase/thioredoxin
MKVKLFWKKDCSYCDKLKEELKKLPKKYPKPILIENKNISDGDRKNLKMFPTMVFYSDDERKIKDLIGFYTIEKIVDTYEKTKNLVHLQEQYQRMIERDSNGK